MGDELLIQWFPGHMTKTIRKIKESLKLVDIVAEIIDARIPMSSRNPDLDKLVESKPRIILMNKSDMSDPIENNKWLDFYKKSGVPAIAIDCKSGNGFKNFVPLVRKILKDRIEKWKSKGMINKNIRVMVAGVPNCGKSSFINKISKSNRAKTEDRPGVTRGNQWFSIEKGLEILDTPGVLWPKFDDPKVGEKLAFTGAIKDQILDTEQLSLRLLQILSKEYPQNLANRFKLEDTGFESLEGYELLKLIGKKRGMLISGGEVDLERAAIMVLDEFRSTKLGRITLEKAPQ